MTDIRQSVEYANYLKSQGWIVERIDKVNYFIKRLPFIGSILKIQRPKKVDFKVVDRLCRRYGIFQIIIEPLTTISNYKLSKSSFLPTKTLHLDLTKPLKFNKETRRSIRKGSETQVKEHSSPSDVKIFRDAWKKSIKFTRYVPSLESLLNLRKSFPDNYSTFLTSHNGSTGSPQVISGAIFLRTQEIAYYWQAFTGKVGRASLSQYALLYQGILWAKKMGCKVFDFEGIYDERFPNKSWLGFTRFKKSFGGTEILYPGCYTKWNLNNIFHRFR